MKIKNKILLIFIFTVISINLFSQTTEDKKNKIIGKETFFGITFNPTIPTKLIQNNDRRGTVDSLQMEVNQDFGYVFGVEIRHNFTKRFSLQTGINFIRRNYDAKVKIASLMYFDLSTSQGIYSYVEKSEELHFIAYEIPIIAQGFLRLSENIYMNIGGGQGFEFYPTDIYKNNFYGQRRVFILPGMLFNVGLELRTKNSGIFYLGASYKMHLIDIIHVVITNDYGTKIAYIDASGNYLAINLKYYLN
jgi:hypothetical protein